LLWQRIYLLCAPGPLITSNLGGQKGARVRTGHKRQRFLNRLYQFAISTELDVCWAPRPLGELMKPIHFHLENAKER
jgi:hypothetical protein